MEIPKKLKDEVWEKINPSKEGWVCLSCMEDELGRKINSDDLDLILQSDWVDRNMKQFDERKAHQEVAKYLHKHFPTIYKQLQKMMLGK